jgi:hypothetical protein
MHSLQVPRVCTHRHAQGRWNRISLDSKRNDDVRAGPPRKPSAGITTIPQPEAVPRTTFYIDFKGTRSAGIGGIIGDALTHGRTGSVGTPGTVIETCARFLLACATPHSGGFRLTWRTDRARAPRTATTSIAGVINRAGVAVITACAVWLVIGRADSCIGDVIVDALIGWGALTASAAARAITLV